MTTHNPPHLLDVGGERLGERSSRHADHYVRNQGWSSGRAANVYKEKFGVWPRQLHDMPKLPSRDVANFVDAGIKRYIKQIRRKQ